MNLVHQLMELGISSSIYFTNMGNDSEHWRMDGTSVPTPIHVLCLQKTHLAYQSLIVISQHQ